MVQQGKNRTAEKQFLGMKRWPLVYLADLWVGLRGPGMPSVIDLQARQHLNAAVDWIQRAHIMASDGGISKGFDLLRNKWAPSYPETTGYTIPTLLNAARLLQRRELETLAFSLADYLLENTTPEGGVAHWQTRAKPIPIVFDTGQVMFGWLAASKASAAQRYLQAAVRAGDWLVSAQDPSGAWKCYQHLGVTKVIDTRVAWALLELHQYTPKETYIQAAVRNLEWAVKQQNSKGWFQHCSFVEGQDPFTHTLAYTAEGLFECGCLINEARYIDAARLMADALLARQRSDGKLASTYSSTWRATSHSSCLTGNCQMSRLWLRLYGLSGQQAYLVAAQKAMMFVVHTLSLETPNPNVRGAVAGSWPIYGQYERFKYPNWATKFFVDAVLTLDQVENGSPALPYMG